MKSSFNSSITAVTKIVAYIFSLDLGFEGDTGKKVIYQGPSNNIHKGNCAIADLRYAKEDSINPSTQILAAKRGLLRIYALNIPTEVL